MRKKSFLFVCLLALSAVAAPAIVLAEGLDQTSSTVESTEEMPSSSTAESTSESQTTLWDIEDDNHVQYDSDADRQKITEPETAVINGQVVQLDPPEKATKYDADTTEAPKEKLQQGLQRSDRSVVQTIPMYRLYNPNSGEHFYTGNGIERDKVRDAGWVYEGIGWQAPTNGDPVYRMYNPNAGDHHYTMNQAEVDNLKRHGWSYEGISWYSDTSKAIKVYRAYNPNARAGSHNYTMNYNEQRNLTSQGWRDEGIAWYAAVKGQDSNEDYRLLGVKNYNQYALGAPSGCEGASLLQALQYKGKLTDWSLTSFLNTIPKSPNGDPNNGFVGSPFVENAWTYSAIYPAPLTSWGQGYGNVQNISGSSMDTLLGEVKNGNPVVAWVTINFQPIRWGQWNFGAAANNNHAVTLDGYNKASNQVHVSDPISGSYWMNRTTFETIYNARKYAVVVR